MQSLTNLSSNGSSKSCKLVCIRNPNIKLLLYSILTCHHKNSSNLRKRMDGWQGCMCHICLHNCLMKMVGCMKQKYIFPVCLSCFSIFLGPSRNNSARAVLYPTFFTMPFISVKMSRKEVLRISKTSSVCNHSNQLRTSYLIYTFRFLNAKTASLEIPNLENIKHEKPRSKVGSEFFSGYTDFLKECAKKPFDQYWHLTWQISMKYFISWQACPNSLLQFTPSIELLVL